ncbi:MAG: PilZ domain-containing protein [Deltaproteobacteria bacterium]|nr:PilZ domain-containing protein [Deltaproteobacteria bacterium]MBW2071384.1 PilZ domain-containing protein [Deltaproteobacteria bacterium]
MERSRLDARVDVRWPVAIETVMGTIQAETVNISLTGALLDCVQPLPLGDVVKITMNASERFVEMVAEVVRSRHFQHAGSREPHYKIAIKFVQVPRESSRFLALVVNDLRRIAERRDKLFEEKTSGGQQKSSVSNSRTWSAWDHGL